MSPDDALTRLAEVGSAMAMRAVSEASGDFEVGHIARLAVILAHSGDVLGPVTDEVVDVASTGGPGSLSTLLAPLFVVALGGIVSKIAVPGRPAGGLDTLGSIVGYRVDCNAKSAQQILNMGGYLHVAAGETFCPLDAAFFAWRQRNGTQAIPSLAIASLLAKKVAAGAGRVVLDVRVGPHGNFGATLDEARSNSEMLVAVASELGITAMCVISDAPAPAQPWIGRGEALAALAMVLLGDDSGRLRLHAEDCLRMATIALGLDGDFTVTAVREGALQAHHRMLEAHGANPADFLDRAAAVKASARVQLRAVADGELRIDIEGLRRALVARQTVERPLVGASFSDPAGVRFAVEPGGVVSQNDLLAGVRDSGDPLLLLDELRPHVTVAPASGRRHNPIEMEVVHG